MKVIAGLGNPGRSYERTRHNVGWWVVDHLADVWHFDGWKRDHDALVNAGHLGTTRIRLVKPQTYMNLSGAALTPYTRRPLWSPARDLLVIVDDIALPLGTIRLRAQGSAGGHNGLKSVEQVLGTREYARLRIGIRPVDEQRELGDLADFVLSSFGKAERETVLDQLPRITEAVEVWAREGVDVAMSRYN